MVSKTKAKAAPQKAKAAPAKAPKPEKPREKKDHRFLRAFRLIADNPRITPDTIAKRASMSTKMAGGCILAWNAAIRILGDKEVLAVDAAELAAELIAAPTKAKHAPQEPSTAVKAA